MRNALLVVLLSPYYYSPPINQSLDGKPAESETFALNSNATPIFPHFSFAQVAL
jgi:hypothetical protein